MEHLITLLSWSFFLLLNQKSSIIYAPVSDRSSCHLGALLPRCEPLVYLLFLSDLPGVYPNESLSRGRLTDLSDEQLWDWDVHHRFVLLQPQVLDALQMWLPLASAVWSKQVTTKVSRMWAIRKWSASFSGPKLWRTTLSLRRLLLVVITVTLTRHRNTPRQGQNPQVRRTNRLFLFP